MKKIITIFIALLLCCIYVTASAAGSPSYQSRTEKRSNVTLIWSVHNDNIDTLIEMYNSTDANDKVTELFGEKEFHLDEILDFYFTKNQELIFGLDYSLDHKVVVCVMDNNKNYWIEPAFIMENGAISIPRGELQKKVNYYAFIFSCE